MTALPPQGRSPLSVPSIDGFRGLAVLFIVLGHCWNELGRQMPLVDGPIRNVFVASFVGVDMLFIVSGFVLFLPVVSNGSIGDVRSYALRRAARILPAFYVALVFSYFVALGLGQLHGGAGRWLSHLLFLHTEAHPVRELGFGVNGAMWTMAVEVAFYVSLPLIAGAYRKRPFIGLAIAFGVAELWHAGAVHLPRLLEMFGWSWEGAAQAQIRMALSFPSYAGQFAIGMTAAWVYVWLLGLRNTKRLRSTALAVQAAAIVGSLTILSIRGAQGLAKQAGPLDHWVKTADRTLFFAALVLATALAPAFARRPFDNPVVRSIGLGSYGLYLVHQPMIKLMIPALGLEKGTTSNMDLLRLSVVVVAVSILIGLVSFSFLEEPFRRWARRHRPPAAPTNEREPDVALAGVQA